jgi:protein MpaA
MRLKDRKDIGTLSLSPDRYGTSVLGVPLEVWRPAGECKLLLHAGIHGEEGETTVALSRALRALTQPPPHCAVVLAANPDGLIRGTRGNANGVDLNRNFPSKDWSPEPVMHRSTLEDARDVVLSPGSGPASEPETQALMALVEELDPAAVVALHAPIACIDDPNETPLGVWAAEKTGLPLVPDVGYPTPGSFGTWGRERGLPIITWEFSLLHRDEVVREQAPILTEILAGEVPWF